MRDNSLSSFNKGYESGFEDGKYLVIEHIKSEITKSVESASNSTDLLLDLYNLLTGLKDSFTDGEV
jgi:hypothetical protein